MSTEATKTTLSSAMLSASIAVSDMARARPVYEDQLGLSVAEDRPDGSRIYASGGGAWLHVDPFPDNAGKATATLGTWYVAELEQLVDRLSANGVRLERYDDPALQTDDAGSPRPKAAARWPGSRIPMATPSRSSSRPLPRERRLPMTRAPQSRSGDASARTVRAPRLPCGHAWTLGRSRPGEPVQHLALGSPTSQSPARGRTQDAS